LDDPQNASKVVNALKPGGLVVMECGADWAGRNQMLKLFDALQIVRSEIVVTNSDFLVARKWKY
jgi:hypothetical protein